MLYVWDEDRGGRATFSCVSAHRFSAKKVFALSGTSHTSEVCMKACKMWDLNELHVLLLGGLSQLASWTKVIQINIGGQGSIFKMLNKHIKMTNQSLHHCKKAMKSLCKVTDGFAYFRLHTLLHMYIKSKHKYFSAVTHFIKPSH